VGYKLWSSGELLTSADVNAYLMKQSVIVCTSGTRPSSPNYGMLIFETDSGRYQSYSTVYSAWVPLGMTVTGSYTPTLTATTTNPTLGTGGLAEGRFTLFNGKWCAIRGTIKFGSSGTNAGSGQYLIALPFTANSNIANGVSTVGSGAVRSAGSIAMVQYYCSASSTTMAGITTSGNNITSGTPGAWTANDYLSFSMVMEVA
jgi:hypothetical protein